MDQCAAQRRLLSEEFQNNRKVFLALGDETRQQIMIALLENEKVGMRVPEITARTHLSRPAVSHHLQILKDAGLIRMHRVGNHELLLHGRRRGLLGRPEGAGRPCGPGREIRREAFLSAAAGG